MGIPPDQMEKLLVGEHFPGVLDQDAQDVVFRGCEGGRLPVNRHCVTGQVHGEMFGVKNRRILGIGNPPENHAQASHQLSDSERLGQIIVGTGIQGGNLIFFPVPHRYHNDRDLGPFAQAAGDLHAIQVGQPEIQDDQIRSS